MPAKNRKTYDDDADGDRAKKKKKNAAKNNTVLFVLLGGGLVVALLGCVGAGVIGYFIWGRPAAPVAAGAGKDNPKGGGATDNPKGGGGRNNPLVTLVSHKKLDFGFTRKEVEAVLGPGESISLQKANELLAKMKPIDDQQILDDVANWKGVTYVAWYNRNDYIVATFIPSKKYGDLLVDTHLLLHHPDGAIAEVGGMHGHAANLESDREMREKSKKK